jgi:radical SAM protein with 4Fe4S-binding SPASM domain
LYYRQGHNQYFNYLHNSLERIVNNSFNRQRGCRAGEYLIGVSTEGRIYPCHRFIAYAKKYDFCLGDVWNGIDKESEAFKKISAMRKKAVKCLNCRVFSCNRCFATNMALNKDPAAVPENGYCQMNEKISSALRPIIRRLLMEGKLKLKEGEMADLKDKGVLYKISRDEPAELVEDKLDVMARCMIRLVKETQEVKKALSALASKMKDKE